MIAFDTERLNIGQLKLEDAGQLFRTVGDPEVMKHWAGGPDPDLTSTKNRILSIQSHWFKHKFGDWGVFEKRKARLTGFAGLHFLYGMNEVNIGYALEKSYWRKRYGYELCQSVAQYGFSHLSLSQIVAVIWPINYASKNLVVKCGFEFWKK